MSYLAGDPLPVNDFYWRSYTFTLSSTGSAPSLGASTRVGRYFHLGELVVARLTLQIGSGFSAGSGVYLFSLPVEANGIVTGAGYLVDSGTSTYGGISAAIGTAQTNIQLLYQTSQVGASSPFTPASGDVYSVTVVYEPA